MYKNTVKGVVVVVGIVLAILLAYSVSALPNPSAVYCEEMGGEFIKVKNADTSENGICNIDGVECPAWDFYSGKCGTERSICARHGYATHTAHDGEDRFSQEYAVCVREEENLITGMAALAESRGGTVSRWIKGLASYLITGHAVEDMNITLPESAPERITAFSLAGLNRTVKQDHNQNLTDMSIIPPPDKVSMEPDRSHRDSAPIESSGALAALDGAPSSFDWRNYNGNNWLTPVKNQGGCGSCWAFSATGTLEAGLKITRGDPTFDLDLAEQELVSCADDDGCGGGSHASALTSYVDQQGLADEACMPYTATNGACNGCTGWGPRSWHIDDATSVAGISTSSAKNYLLAYGPLGANYYHYGSFDSNGVYRCSGEDNPFSDYYWNHWDHGHAVVIVGYNDAGGYWIIKNSWGSWWNGDGYFKMGYGECEILDGTWPDNSRSIVYIEKDWPAVSVVANVTASNTYRGSYSGSLDSLKTRDASSYIHLMDGCSGGDCVGTDVRLHIPQSALPNPQYIEVLARQKARDATDFYWKLLNPPSSWVDFGYIPQTGTWRIMKYSLCNTEASCEQYFSGGIITTAWFHAGCTSCDQDSMDLDWFVMEAEIDTDDDGVVDSEDDCPTQSGSYCRGCPTPSCGPCSYSPTCPASGQPYCTQHYSSLTLCDSYGDCASGIGDNKLGSTGEYWCKGYCDGYGNCDFANDCSYSASCDPDDDDDGVLDGSDSCPTQSGPSCNSGCPDNTPPSVTLSSPQYSNYSFNSISVSIYASDNCLDKVWFDDGFSNITLVYPYWFIEIFQEGSHNVTAYANDTSGNVNNDSHFFGVTLGNLPLNCTGSSSHYCSAYDSVDDITHFTASALHPESGQTIYAIVNWTGWHYSDDNHWAFFLDNGTVPISTCRSFAVDGDSPNKYTMNCEVTIPPNTTEGNHTLRVTGNDYVGYCLPNETGVDSEANVSLNVSDRMGSLDLVSTYPSGDMNITWHESAVFNITINCTGGRCEDVYLGLDPELPPKPAVPPVPPVSSQAAPPVEAMEGSKGLVPMDSGSPFYTLQQNPYLCGNMTENETCSMSWTVNATGEGQTNWTFFIIYNSSAETHETAELNVTIKTDGDGDGANLSVDCDDTNASLLPPYDGMSVDSNITFCRGMYSLPNGIDIVDDDVVLDCNGSVLTGSLSSEGITLSRVTGSEVKGCSVRNYTKGIYVSSSDNNSVSGNTINNNSYGLYVESSSGNSFTNNSFYDSSNVWVDSNNSYCVNNLSNVYYGFYGPSCPVNVTSYFPPVGWWNISEPEDQTFNMTFEDPDLPNYLLLWWYENGVLKHNVTSYQGGFRGDNESSNVSGGPSLSFGHGRGYLEYNFSGGYFTSGNYTMIAIIGDGYTNITREWNLSVNNTNRVPQWMHPIVNLTVDEDHSIIFDFNASDADNETLTYYINDTNVSMNSSTGLLTYTPPGDWFGSFHVRASAGDGIENATADIVLNISSVNDLPVLDMLTSEVSVNETELVNASDYFVAVDVETDPPFYFFTAPLNSSGMWQTTLDDSGVYNTTITVSDGIVNVSDFLVITVMNASDFDNDMNPDFNDTDDDNDNINDTDDNILGNESDLDTDMNLSIEMNGTCNMSRVFNATWNMTFMFNSTPVVEMLCDFRNVMLNLRNVTVRRQEPAAVRGSLLVRGLHLAGHSKTVYVDHLDPSISTVCIKDADVESIDNISSSCSGTDEYFMPCPGTLGDYNCTNVTPFRYRISGLRFSAVAEMDVPAAPEGGGAGGGGGGGSSGYQVDFNIVPTLDGHDVVMNSQNSADIIFLGEVYKLRVTSIGVLDTMFSIGGFYYSVSTFRDSVDIDLDRDGGFDITVFLLKVDNGKVYLSFRLYSAPEEALPVLPPEYSKSRRDRLAEQQAAKEDSAVVAEVQPAQGVSKQVTGAAEPLLEVPAVVPFWKDRTFLSAVAAGAIVFFALLFFLLRGRKRPAGAVEKREVPEAGGAEGGAGNVSEGQAAEAVAVAEVK